MNQINDKVGFVILHYLAIEDTIACIQSIEKNIKNIEYLIVVVDNCSPDDSGDILEKKYESYRNIEIIKNKDNLGFSKGNNVGIKLARKKGCSFVVVLNNDTVVLQENFVNIILNEYSESNFAVLGPQVIDPINYNGSSPILEAHYSGLEERKEIFHMWRKKYLTSCLKLVLFKNFLKEESIDSPLYKEKNLFSDKRCENVPLHGCCLILSPKYFEYYDGFEELTFMYGEETILEMNCIKNGLLMVYNPEMKIYHKEAISTKKSYKNNKIEIEHNKRMMQAAKALFLKAKEMDKMKR